VEDGLRAAGSEAAAERLHAAVTTSGQPGEVWPETLSVLRDLLRDAPMGLDRQLAKECAQALEEWPDGLPLRGRRKSLYVSQSG
jgi:thioester reductase-like protein